MEWGSEAESGEPQDHSIFGEVPKRYSLAEAAEKSDDELYRVAVNECEHVISMNPELRGKPEVALEVNRRTGVGIGIAALAASNISKVA